MGMIFRNSTTQTKLTISNRTSPAPNASPSLFFHDAIPPSVMVGDIAGIWKLEMELRATVLWNTGEDIGVNYVTGVK